MKEEDRRREPALGTAGDPGAGRKFTSPPVLTCAPRDTQTVASAPAEGVTHRSPSPAETGSVESAALPPLP